MNYGHRAGCNLLPTFSDGITSPDILFMVHHAMGNSIYLKKSLPQLHILRFQKGIAISLFWNEYSCIMQQRPNQALIFGSQSSSPQNDIAKLFHGV